MAPILCMDTDQANKGILNADLPMPGADIPIISLSTPSPKKSSQAYSQVCGMYITFILSAFYQHHQNIYTYII